jgi:hypothetical protein
VQSYPEISQWYPRDLCSGIAKGSPQWYRQEISQWYFDRQEISRFQANGYHSFLPVCRKQALSFEMLKVTPMLMVASACRDSGG